MPILFADLRGLQVSAHFFVRRDGALLQYVSTDQRAWHAARPPFRRTPAVQWLFHRYRNGRRGRCAFPATAIPCPGGTDGGAGGAPRLSQVRGHEHIAPGRKTDPGPFFDWHFLPRMLAGNPARTNCVSAYFAGIGLSIHALKSQPKSYRKRQKNYADGCRKTIASLLRWALQLVQKLDVKTICSAITDVFLVKLLSKLPGLLIATPELAVHHPRSCFAPAGQCGVAIWIPSCFMHYKFTI